MESTQVIDWDAEEEEETELSSGSLGYSVEPIGQLRLFSGTHGPERDFPLYLGKNVVGRSPDCSVALPFPSISKQHAVIEISAWNKAPILQDCGSLNGTQIVKPPRVLPPGVSHRLRDQELILFADFPCQYHRLDVPPPLVPRSLLTIEKTPRIRIGSQNSRVLLAEDSEEEGDFPSGRCVANGPRNTASPSATVVPESDEEVSSPAPSVPGPSSPFGLGSDTDEEQGQQPGVEESSLADSSGAAGEAEQPGANGMTAGIQAQPTEHKLKDTKVKKEAGRAGVSDGSVLEKSPTLGEDSDTEVDEEHKPGFVDSETDVEEERIPVTPSVAPVKKKQVLLAVGIGDPGAPGVAHLQDSLAGSGTDVEDKTALDVPLERNHTPMVINSDTDEEEEEEVSAALTLAHLKERGIALWSRDPGAEEVKSQPQVLVERSQSASGRDSDTDVEEESSGQKRKIVPDSPMDVDEALTVTQPESQPPRRPNDADEYMDMSSPDSHLVVNQASFAVVGKTRAQVEEEVPGPSVILGEKHQVPLEGAQPPEEAWETAVQEGSSSPEAAASVRPSQQPVAEDAGTECATAFSEQESTLEVGAQSGSPAAPVEQVVIYTDTSGNPTLPQREGAQTPTGREREAHVGRTKHAKECCDEPEDVCLPATQCFVEGESQHPEAVQSLENEPTQLFPCTLPQEPGPSHLSPPTPGADTLDVPWEVLATQPFCLREQSETSEPQLIDTHEAHGSRPSLPREPPGHQHLVHTSPVHTELLRIEGREIQTVEKAMGIPKEMADRMTPEREPLEREIRGRTENSERDVIGEELIQGTEDREPKVLARDSHRKEADKDLEGNRESLEVEIEMSKDSQKRERKVEKPEPKREWEPADLEVTPDRGVTEEGSHDQKGQIASLTLKPGVGVKDLEGLASAPIISGSRADGGKGDPLSPGRQQRGRLSCQTTPAGKASRGDPEPPDHCLFSSVPEASTQSLLPSQSQKQSTTQPLLSTSSSEIPLPESLHTKPNVRPRRSSRMTPSPHSSAALKPYTTCPTNQPAASRPTSRPTRGRANRSSTRTPELTVPADPELQPSTSTAQPVIPKLTSQVTEGRVHSSVKMPEPVLTGPEIQSPTSTEQSVTPDLKPRATRGRQSKSLNKTPEPLISTGPELQPPTSIEQPVIPKPTSRVTRGRPRKTSVRTPESVVSTGPELQPLTSIEQPVIPEPRATRGRPSKSSIKTPEPVVPTGPELQPLTSAKQPVTPNLTSRASRGRSSKSTRTPEPIVQTGPEFHPSTSTEQPDTHEPSSQGRTRRSSVRTPESSVPTTPELQPFTSKKQPTPKPTALVTRGRTYKPSTEDCESVGPVAPDFEPSTSIDHLVTPKVTGQSLTQSSPLSASPVSSTPDLKPPVPIAQPVTPEPIPQANHQRKRRATGKQGSRTVPMGHKSYSALSEPEPQSSASQSSGASEADSPRQKRPRRQASQKTIVIKEEPVETEVKEEPQETAIPTPEKRKRDHAEEESQGKPTRSRRTKPNQETAPKVLFTGVVDSRGERAVLALGGSLASSVNEASHLVTDRIRRTVKFLCALGKGIPILSLNWLYQSRKAGCFLPPDDYLVTDPEQEKNFSFSLRDSLCRARERRLLEDYEIHVTPGVQPPPPQMGEIISCCGGTFLPNMPHSYKLHRVIITCTEDLPRCAIPSRLGLPLLSPEFLLTGVLKQEATPEAFVFSNLEMSST